MEQKTNSAAASKNAAAEAPKKPHRKVSSAILGALVRIAAVATAATLVIIVGYILVMGIPAFNPDLFALEYNSQNVSMLPSLVNTLLAVALTLVIAVPLGVMAAVFLVEYTTRGNKFVKVVRITAETLAGIPSIVYGLFGMLFFVTFLGWGLSLLSGCLTLAIMVLPTIMRTTEEALRAVPDSYREGSFGLGAGRLRTVLSVVLPPAMPGILGGIILSIGRIVGESAALIFTAGTVAAIPGGIFDSVRTMSVHMYVLSCEGLHIDATYATAVVLLIIVVAINALASFAAKRLTKV
ncbi:phosphate ABC transporter permease PtsA [Slackia faecicanis]|uniref:Phosphate transport system permease protein PstA n=1 Tax=Slackia faecicanis TaxID=255723 RepID=A0A3N0AF24_9ACTN|nr:phosphate ABC transporter permease PstA [Slackia faecicanis]RNL19433.1 phosphate ABC transporter permease PtsA [Slackia faecicanis]